MSCGVRKSEAVPLERCSVCVVSVCCSLKNLSSCSRVAPSGTELLSRLRKASEFFASRVPSLSPSTDACSF